MRSANTNTYACIQYVYKCNNINFAKNAEENLVLLSFLLAWFWWRTLGCVCLLHDTRRLLLPTFSSTSWICYCCYSFVYSFSLSILFFHFDFCLHTIQMNGSFRSCVPCCHRFFRVCELHFSHVFAPLYWGAYTRTTSSIHTVQYFVHSLTHPFTSLWFFLS